MLLMHDETLEQLPGNRSVAALTGPDTAKAPKTDSATDSLSIRNTPFRPNPFASQEFPCRFFRA